MAEEKVELKEGIMTNRELAKWFGIKEGTFKNNKSQKLEMLKEYAIFEEIKGKIKILKIIKPIFVKGSKNYKIIKEQTQIQWDKSGLDTCRLVANKINRLGIEELNVEDSTLYSYTCKSKRQLWGKINSMAEGEIGFCKSEFCKVVNNKCEVLNEREIKIKELLLKKHFGKNNQETLAMTQGLIISGEITIEEGAEILTEMLETTKGNYIRFITEFKALTGEKIVIGTRITNNALKQQLAPPREEEKEK